jgi:hypothetical protein
LFTKILLNNRFYTKLLAIQLDQIQLEMNFELKLRTDLLSFFELLISSKNGFDIENNRDKRIKILQNQDTVKDIKRKIENAS